MIGFLKQLITLNELLTIRPSALDKNTSLYLAGFFSLFLVLAIVFYLKAKKNKKDYLLHKSYNRFFAMFLTISLIGFVWDFFAYEGAIILAGKFNFVVLMLVFLVWLFFIIKFHIKTIPKKKQEVKQKKEFEKYLP